MEFSGTIVITDPCYVAADSDWDNEQFDYINCTIHNKIFTKYLWKATGVGDGSWGVYQLDNILGQIDLEKHIDDLEKCYSTLRTSNVATLTDRVNYEELVNKSTNIGRFCIDSGSFGVFYLEEVMKYNPSFLANHGNWCYTIINDFSGVVEPYNPAVGQFNLIGVGNKTFFAY